MREAMNRFELSNRGKSATQELISVVDYMNERVVPTVPRRVKKRRSPPTAHQSDEEEKQPIQMEFSTRSEQRNLERALEM